MPRLLAASISMRSSARPSRIETHASQRSHGSPSWRFVQLRALARIRASDVLPVPRGPTNRIACETRSGADGVAERLDDRGLADDLGERLGAPAAIERLVRARSSGCGGRLGSGRAHGAPARWRSAGWRRGSVGSAAGRWSMPCTHRRPASPRARHDERLGPGRSAAPDDGRLVLLPSGPDTVRGSSLRGTRSSTSLEAAAFEDAALGWEFSPAGADCRYRAPLVPRLARPGRV